MAAVDLSVVRSRRAVRADQAREATTRRPRASLALFVTLRALLGRLTPEHGRFVLESLGCALLGLAALTVSLAAGLAVFGLACWIMSWRSEKR